MAPTFQSTQPSQAVTGASNARRLVRTISIHTALAGCDGLSKHLLGDNAISIHTALAGCDI